ncbi:MAG: flagellar biosynthetic protein FliO [Fimbriimonadales bacterium]
MRLVGFLLALMLATAGMADPTITGLKPEVVASPAASSSVGMAPLIQMLVALGLVVGLLKFVVPKLANKLNKRLATPLDSSIRIEESANFAGGTLYVVQARSKSLLLSVSTHGVACLADLTDATAPEPERVGFADILTAQSHSAPASPAQFQEAVIEVEVPLTEEERQAKAMLDRLSRIAA